MDRAFFFLLISIGGSIWGQISSVTESSHNNLFPFEAQSPGEKNQIVGNKGGLFVCSDIGSVKVNKVKVASWWIL